MTQFLARRIHKSQWQSRDEVRELLQAIFVGEILRPSRCLWLVSPWISDIPVIDNRLGTFDAFDPMWGSRQIRLSELIAHLLRVGAAIRLATRPAAHNRSFLELIQTLPQTLGLDPDALGVFATEALHEKGLLGDDYYLGGSMNITFSGVELLEEAVSYDTDPTTIGETRLTYYQRWGGRLPSAMRS